VLTATDANADSVEKAVAMVEGQRVTITMGDAKIAFTTLEVGGDIEFSGHHTPFADKIVAEMTDSP